MSYLKIDRFSSRLDGKEAHLSLEISSIVFLESLSGSLWSSPGTFQCAGSHHAVCHTRGGPLSTDSHRRSRKYGWSGKLERPTYPDDFSGRRCTSNFLWHIDKWNRLCLKLLYAYKPQGNSAFSLLVISRYKSLLALTNENKRMSDAELIGFSLRIVKMQAFECWFFTANQ